MADEGTGPQAPTPGPLDSESVKLLVKGDYIRGPNGKIYRLQEWGDGGFLIFIDEPHDGYFVTLCAFIGRPDADGWVKCRFASVPDYLRGIQVEAKTYNDLIRPAQKAENVAWSNMIAFRLAPPAPVEASGETREAVARIVDPSAWRRKDEGHPGGENFVKKSLRLADRILALRPSPVAFGGQHSTPTDFPPDDVLACDTTPQPSGDTRADALRAAGWSVAVHNDYRLNGEAHTFWLWTHPDGRWVKGEGRTDEDALSQCVALENLARSKGFQPE